ncbi:MAG: glycosyltransferase family 4 protein [Winogradskyella arenosi]
MKHKNILLVTSEFPPQPGGIGDHTYNVAYYLSQLGYQVCVIADNRSGSGTEEAIFDATLPFEVFRIRVTRPRVNMYLKRIKLLRAAEQNADVVLASGKFSLWGAALCVAGKKPMVAVVHGTEVNFKNTILNYSVDWALSRFGKIIAVSEFTKSLLPKDLQSKTDVIPNGFNPVKWKDVQCIEVRLQGSPKLITVGHVSERKGQREVIQLLPKLQQTYPDITYHCVGLPTEQEDCETLAKSLGVEKRVFFHGRATNDSLKALLEDSDVFVMLSTITASGDVEGFGIALLEANYLGIPAIGASGCGIEDAIDPGNSGFLVPLGDEAAFESALKELLKCSDQYAETSKQWAENHDWKVIIEQYVAVLEGVVVSS